MDEQKALKMQALYDNMWGVFAVGLLLPIVLYTVWGMVELMNVPQLDVNNAMEALKPAAAQQAAPVEAPAAEAPAPAEAAPVH